MSRSVMKALDSLYSVLCFVVSLCHFFFCESSGLFGFNSFSKSGFFWVFFLLLEVGHFRSFMPHVTFYMLWLFKLAQNLHLVAFIVFEVFEKRRKTFYTFAFSCIYSFLFSIFQIKFKNYEKRSLSFLKLSYKFISFYLQK